MVVPHECSKLCSLPVVLIIRRNKPFTRYRTGASHANDPCSKICVMFTRQVFNALRGHSATSRRHMLLPRCLQNAPSSICRVTQRHMTETAFLHPYCSRNRSQILSLDRTSGNAVPSGSPNAHPIAHSASTKPAVWELFPLFLLSLCRSSPTSHATVSLARNPTNVFRFYAHRNRSMVMLNRCNSNCTASHIGSPIVCNGCNVGTVRVQVCPLDHATAATLGCIVTECC